MMVQAEERAKAEAESKARIASEAKAMEVELANKPVFGAEQAQAEEIGGRRVRRVEINCFRDGSLVLSCGDDGMESDLVFASGAMKGDPALEKQREILEWIASKVNAPN